MFSEDDLLPISGLQHVVYCERQVALIHVERYWQENVHTVDGHHLHERVDSEGDETRGDTRVLRGVSIRSLALGIAGIADVVELRGSPAHPIVFPIEYKRGKPKGHRADEVQLCAQALCLEEMLSVNVGSGALFYAKPRRRTDVSFDEPLRLATRDAIERFRRIVLCGVTPPPEWSGKCCECSLVDGCQPRAPRRSAARYLEAIFGAPEKR
ncbi:MAG: CRISPR-associated protein Cas4 [Thermoanaerobaculia bacterium]